MGAVLRRPATLRTALSVAVAVVAVGWPFVLPDSTHFYGVLSVAYALVALSLTVLTGWAGQISLCQAAFLGMGVYVAAPLLEHGVPLPLVLVAAGLVGAAVSLVIGIPSLRLRGVYLAVVTLAFGAAAEKYFFPLRGYDADPVARPTILGVSTATDRNLYLVALIVLAVALFIAANLRRSDVGRALFAIRDSEEAAMAMGIRIARYKVGAFALSAAFATTAGVLYAMLFLSTPSPSQFGVLQSFFLLALPVIGGLETLAGPIVGGVIMGTSQPMVDAFHLRLFLVSGLLLVGVTLARNDGLVGLVQRLVRSAREELAPQTLAVHGSFLPDDIVPVDTSDLPPRIRARGPALPKGTRVRFRLRSSPAPRPGPAFASDSGGAP
jgi:branched-chain amino acid transport system permease protein